ncbi:MAG: M28 family peptidase [Bacteroidia bacterium]|nr:M28 family peptidase [Bacteroidia bacterium]
MLGAVANKTCAAAITICVLTFGACRPGRTDGSESRNEKPKTSGSAEWFASAPAAEFDSDSAYAFLTVQTAFGPRIPGTTAHKKCGDFIAGALRRYGAKVYEQTTSRPRFGSKPTPIRNIVGEFNPQAPRRIMLSAHWDTRPVADSDPHNPNAPFDGANDGASGTAVLLEIARQLQKRAPNVGVDLFFWDAEDGGTSGDDESWCLGSQYWAENPHRPGYRALFNINLDMVGAKGASFPQEAHSMQFAPDLARTLWTTAHELGYGAFFPFVSYGPIVDDHYFIAKKAGIPAVNIIHLDVERGGFFPYWHTREDTPDKIDKAVLEAVGKTVLTVVYRVRGT